MIPNLTNQVTSFLPILQLLSYGVQGHPPPLADHDHRHPLLHLDSFISKTSFCTEDGLKRADLPQCTFVRYLRLLYQAWEVTVEDAPRIGKALKPCYTPAMLTDPELVLARLERYPHLSTFIDRKWVRRTVT